MTAFKPASSSDEQPDVDEDPEAEKVSEPDEIETCEGGEADDAEALAKEALDKGLDPLQCITEGLTKGIQKVGDLFASGEYFLPELIIGADTMKTALDISGPAMVGDQVREVAGTIVLDTVEGDLHEIGKTLVGTMLTANGFKVIDIGVDEDASEFIDAIKNSGADIVGASALLTTNS